MRDGELMFLCMFSRHDKLLRPNDNSESYHSATERSSRSFKIQIELLNCNVACSTDIGTMLHVTQRVRQNATRPLQNLDDTLRLRDDAASQ